MTNKSILHTKANNYQTARSESRTKSSDRWDALTAEHLAHGGSLGTKITFNREVQGLSFWSRLAPFRELKGQKELIENYLNNAAGAFVNPEHKGLGFKAIQEDAYVERHLAIFKGYLEKKFGANPKLNKFFVKLQEEQARNISKFWGLANQVASKQKKNKDQEYQEAVQKAMKKKYKVERIKKYLEDVATALAGGVN
ncbi:hypothetical protein DSO57_1030268 [Entomophthora muscae]|uniref:Uncharacterized protein n=1 Tax=Entomophthora muscae TaxID=34485 RepID=A0ACC2S323_9FUNG|nr:hypothetical protein DSO57_1030268 [Entomophthora muscae]